MRTNSSSFARAAAWCSASRSCGAPSPGAAHIDMMPHITMSSMSWRRRDALRIMAACMADWCLPRNLFAQRGPASRKPERRAIVVTFGGGVRYEDTLAPEGWINIPHLSSELVPQGIVFSAARHEGLTGHFNSTGALVTGSRQNVDG